MTDDDLKKIQKSIKDEIRPVKEAVEILQSKMSYADMYQKGTSSSIRHIKDQQSVINEKLDDMKSSLEEKIDTKLVESEERLKKSLKEELGQMIEDSESRVVKGISDFLTEHVLTQIDDKAEKSATDRLDNRVDHLTDKVSDHENRIKKLEGKSPISLPSAA